MMMQLPFCRNCFRTPPISRLRYMLVSAKANQYTYSDSLSELLQEERLGPFLSGVNRKTLLDGASAGSFVGLLKDVLTFKKKEGKTYKDMCQ